MKPDETAGEIRIRHTIMNDLEITAAVFSHELNDDIHLIYLHLLNTL